MEQNFLSFLSTSHRSSVFLFLSGELRLSLLSQPTTAHLLRDNDRLLSRRSRRRPRLLSACLCSCGLKDVRVEPAPPEASGAISSPSPNSKTLPGFPWHALVGPPTPFLNEVNGRLLHTDHLRNSAAAARFHFSICYRRSVCD